MTKNKIKILLPLLFLLLASLLILFIKTNPGKHSDVKSSKARQKTIKESAQSNLIRQDSVNSGPSIKIRHKKARPAQFSLSNISIASGNFSKPGSSPAESIAVPQLENIPLHIIDSISTSIEIHLNNYLPCKEGFKVSAAHAGITSSNLLVSIDTCNTVLVSRKDKFWYGTDTLKFIAAVNDAHKVLLQALILVKPFFNPPELANIPDQIIREGKKFSSINLNRYVLNNEENHKITWSCNGSNHIKIHIDSTGIAAISLPNEDWKGSDTVTFTATNSNNYSTSVMAVFKMESISLFARQPVKPVVNVLTTAANDILSLITSPLDWDSTDFFIYPSIVIGTYLFMIGDQPIHNWISHYGTAKEIPIMKFGTFYGQPTTTQVSALSIFSLGLLFDNKEATQIGLEIYESYFIANNITSIIKRIFGRDRPYENNGPYHFNPFPQRNNPINSFPSGHSTLAFSLSSVLAAHTDKVWLKAIIFTPAVITAVSRVYHNVHWFSDVAMGGVIGYMIGNYLVARHNGSTNDHVHIEFDDYGRFGIKINF